MKNKTLGLFALGIIALLGFGFVSAYHGDYTSEGPNYNDDLHEAMEAVFFNEDYNAWVELMTENGRHPRVVDLITEENFAKFVEAHEAGISGDYEKASELRAELGLNNGNGQRDGTGYRKGMGQGSMNRVGTRGQGNYGECLYAD